MKGTNLAVEQAVNGLIGLILGMMLWRWWGLHRRGIRRWWQRHRERQARQWHPHSAEACAACRAVLQVSVVRCAAPVEAYAQSKRKPGRPKQLSTGGFACPCRDCRYFGVTEAMRHALVGYGKIGKDHDIQRWRCQACGTVFSSRRGTPLYYLKSEPQQIHLVLWFLAKGVDRSVLVRYTGRRDATLARWLERVGQQSRGWHNVLFQGLTLALVQMDEICVKMRGRTRFRWLWLAIDPVSKAIPALHLGGRRAEDAQALVHELHGRLSQDAVPACTSDGLRAYFYALTAHFGRWHTPPNATKPTWQVDDRLLYGQLVKRRERRHVVFTTMRMLWGQRHQLTAVLTAHGFLACVQTAIIERVNLTIRQSIASLTRKTWSLPCSEPCAGYFRHPCLSESRFLVAQLIFPDRRTSIMPVETSRTHDSF